MVEKEPPPWRRFSLRGTRTHGNWEKESLCSFISLLPPTPLFKNPSIVPQCLQHKVQIPQSCYVLLYSLLPAYLFNPSFLPADLELTVPVTLSTSGVCKECPSLGYSFFLYLPSTSSAWIGVIILHTWDLNVDITLQKISSSPCLAQWLPMWAQTIPYWMTLQILVGTEITSSIS